MRKSLIVSLLALGLLLFGTGVQAASPSGSGHLVVLMYHRFDAGGSISTPMSEFERQVNYLDSEGYEFLSLREVRRHLRERKPFPDKAVLLTVDDGYESTYTHAFPFLEKKGIPWVLYVYTEAIEKGYSSSLSWDEIREMADAGVSVGNHTYSHERPTGEEFRSGDWIEREILQPQQRLESKLDTDVFSFAIPYGEYDTRLMEVLEDRGKYEVVWGIDPGVVDPREKRYVLPRFGINGSTSWSEFKQKLNRLPLTVESLRPPAGTPVRAGDTIELTFEHPERYREGPINVFFSEVGALEWSWDAEKKRLLIPVGESLSTSWNRLIVTVYDDEFNRYRYFSKGFPTASSE